MTQHIATQLIHGGISEDPLTGSVNIPIYQTSTFHQESLGVTKGYEYSRTGNPTREAVEKLIASLEQGHTGLAFASGMAANTAVLFLFQQGDKIAISSNVYGGTYRVLDQVFDHYGLTYEIIDTTSLEEIEKAMKKEDIKALYIESPANPLLSVTDIQEASKIAHKYHKQVIVDNTFMTPYLQRPLTLGADIVLHSATKYLGGHSDLVAGLVVVDNEELAKKLSFIQNATGGVLGPFDAFLLIRGIKTLGVRMDAHVKNATTIAQWLQTRAEVAHVYYPGLHDDPGYAIMQKQADGAGGVVSFELNENYDHVAFFNALQVITLGESLGGVESLACHPSTMTHAAIPQEIREKVGITEGLIRLSIGIEDVHDLQ